MSAIPNCFPIGIPVPMKNAFYWVRTYPASMVLDKDDHLAVASGALERYQQSPDRFQKRGLCWVENLSGVKFDDVDVAYLDWVMGNSKNATAQWIAHYAKTEGKWRFAADSTFENGQVFDKDQVHEPGWMYSNLATFLAYQARRDSNEIRTASGFCPMFDDVPQDTWLEGAEWGIEEPDWTPRPHDACMLMEAIKARRTPARYEVIKSARDVDTMMGRVSWRACVQVTAVKTSQRAKGWKYKGEYANDRVELRPYPILETVSEPTTIDLPGRWLPSTETFTACVDTGCGQVDVEVSYVAFVDRHQWDAALWATMELRDLLVRVTAGPDSIPDEYPVEWVSDRVNDIMSRLPSIDEVKTRSLDRACRMAAQLKSKIFDTMAEWNHEAPIDLDRFCDLVNEVLCGQVSRKRHKIIIDRQFALRSVGGWPVVYDYASCSAEGK